MKQILNLLNWRFDLVMLILFAALVLLVCEADSLLLLIASKVAAVAMGVLGIALGVMWNDKLEIDVEE